MASVNFGGPGTSSDINATAAAAWATVLVQE